MSKAQSCFFLSFLLARKNLIGSSTTSLLDCEILVELFCVDTRQLPIGMMRLLVYVGKPLHNGSNFFVL